jgi:hypothetical protein
MELAARSLVEELVGTGRKKPRRRNNSLPLTPAPAHRVRRCACGVCAMCLDNARWERIFQAKFADPTYYQGRVPKQGSSLGWL